MNLRHLRALAWVRDNDHSIAAMVPTYSPPGEHKAFRLSGYGNRREFSQSVWQAIRPYLKLDINNSRRIYAVTDEGLNLLKEHGV